MFNKKDYVKPVREAKDGTFIDPTGNDGGFAANNTVMYGEEQDVDDL